MDMLLGYIAYAAGIAIAAIVIWVLRSYVIPWFKVKLEAAKVRLGDDQYEALRNRLIDLMSAAEEKFREDEKAGTAKKEWVIDELVKMFPSVPKDIIGNLIDGLMLPLTKEGLLNQK